MPSAHRSDPPHDLVPDTRLGEGLDAGYRPKHVREAELLARAVVEATAGEERDRMEVGDIKRIHPLVRLGGVARTTHGNPQATAHQAVPWRVGPLVVGAHL